MGKLGNIVSSTKMFLNLLRNIFASWEANSVSATMFTEVDKQGNIDKKHNVSATMFPIVWPGLQSHLSQRRNYFLRKMIFFFHTINTSITQTFYSSFTNRNLKRKNCTFLKWLGMFLFFIWTSYPKRHLTRSLDERELAS